MLPRLLLVVGLSVGVMLPLIWAAFAPVPDLREVSEPDADPVHSGSLGADWRGAPPEAAEPSNSTARSNETTIGTAPQNGGEASAAHSDDLPRAGLSEPTLIKPKVPEADDKEATPGPLGSEETKALPEEAKALPEGAKALPEEAKAVPEGAKALPEGAKALPEEAKALPEGAKALPEEAKAVPEGVQALPEGAKALPEEAKAVPEGAQALPEEAKALPEKATPPPEETTTPTRNVEKLPEVKERYSAPDASPNSRSRARANGTERQKIYRKKQRESSGWIDIMREAGWLAPGRRR
ncbi:MAG: hypothetical protein QOD94_2124 [Alphaproteobacteria bacterium]|nr:hypothetical protein [Alphaproteobacteria bacterium]